MPSQRLESHACPRSGSSIWTRSGSTLAGFSRSPVASYIGPEVEWLSTVDEAVIGVIVFDRTDDDFAAIVLGRDEIGRYRAFDQEVSLASQTDARGWLERMIRWHAGSGASFRKEIQRGNRSLHSSRTA